MFASRPSLLLLTSVNESTGIPGWERSRGQTSRRADSLLCGCTQGQWIIWTLIEHFLYLMSLPPQWSPVPSSAPSPRPQTRDGGGRRGAEGPFEWKEYPVRPNKQKAYQCSARAENRHGHLDCRKEPFVWICGDVCHTVSVMHCFLKG